MSRRDSAKGAIKDASVVLDPAIQSFVNHLATADSPPISDMTPGEARAGLARIQSGVVVDQNADSEDCEVNYDNQRLRFRVVRPNDALSPSSAVMYFHGGGWLVTERGMSPLADRESSNSDNPRPNDGAKRFRTVRFHPAKYWGTERGIWPRTSCKSF